MKRTSLTICLVLGAVWSVACGDDSGSDDTSLPDASTGDASTEDDATEDEVTDESTEDEATEDESTEDEATEDEATEDESAEDEVAEDESAEDEATEDESAEDEATDDTSGDAGTVPELDSGNEPGDGGIDAGGSDATDDVSGDAGGLPLEDGGSELDGGFSVDSGDQPLEGEIGAEGGNVEALGALLVVPPDSIDPPSVISVQQVEAANTEGLVSLAWDFSPNGITFDPPASLTLPFDTGAAGGEPVVIAWLDSDDTWVPLSDCAVDGDEVTCPVSHFTTFGVILAAGADAGGSTGECVMPPCALEIDFESCTPDVAATCESVGGLPPTALNVCYENGTKAQLTNLTSEPLTMSFKTAEGAACYSLEITGATTGNYDYAFKNAEGDVVMTAEVDADSPDVVTYTCDGQQYVVDFSTPECEGESRPPSSDTEGCQFTGCDY